MYNKIINEVAKTIFIELTPESKVGEVSEVINMKIDNQE